VWHLSLRGRIADLRAGVSFSAILIRRDPRGAADDFDEASRPKLGAEKGRHGRVNAPHRESRNTTQHDGHFHRRADASNDALRPSRFRYLMQPERAAQKRAR
jgi:hypothetical protein